MSKSIWLPQTAHFKDLGLQNSCTVILAKYRLIGWEQEIQRPSEEWKALSQLAFTIEQRRCNYLKLNEFQVDPLAARVP